MFPIIVGGVVTFVIMFCVNFFFGAVKDKEGKKSVKLSLLGALAAGVTAAGAAWLISSW
jgi:hypothetical protein